jgi:hypothetical protein
MVEQTLRDTDRSFTVEELARLAYPAITDVQKKHRVSILRTLPNVEKRVPLGLLRTYAPPWRLIVTNRDNVRSYGHGLLRHSWWNAERSLDQIEEILRDREIELVMQPGGIWWTDVEIHKAEAAQNDVVKLLEAKGLVERYRGGGWSAKTADMPAEFREISAQLVALRSYRYGLAADHDAHALLGKFEPPGTPVFEAVLSALSAQNQ